MGFSRRNLSHGCLGRTGLRILAAGLFVGLTLVPAEGRAQDACEDPAKLRFAVQAGGNGLERHKRYKPVLDFLRERTKKKIEVYVPASYDSTTEGMAEGWIDVAAYSVGAYLTARESHQEIVPFASYARKPGHLQQEVPGYELVMIAKKDSEFERLRATEGASLGLVEKDSPTGDLLPRIALVDAVSGELEAHFSDVVYTGGNDLSTMAVYEEDLDLAIVESHRFDELVDNKMVLLEEFKVLWRSPAIPNEPFVYRANLCADLKEQIAGAFLSLHTQYQAREFLKRRQAGRMLPVSDADYQILRDVRAAREQLRQKDRGKIN